MGSKVHYQHFSLEVSMFDSIVSPQSCTPRSLVRSKDAGVFFGEIVEIEGTTVKVRNARRIWYWDGAASLSELAMRGTSKPENCKFPCAVDEVIIFGVIEIVPCTSQAMKSIDSVQEWTQHDN